MAIRFQVLATGSKGNAILVWTPRTRVLIDVGMSCREIIKRLDRTGVGPGEVDALLLSHEHRDHVSGAGVFSRRFGPPVYLSEGTLKYLPPQVGHLPLRVVFQPGTAFAVGDLHVHPFATPHDAHEPAGFVIEHDGVRLGICTDFGVATQLIRTRLQGCHGLVIEANHDMERLINGPYPWHLKQRIRSRHGHHSNVDTMELLRAIHHPGLQSIVFAHLSEVNNHPDLVRQSFMELQSCPEWETVRFSIGEQHVVTEAVEIG